MQSQQVDLGNWTMNVSDEILRSNHREVKALEDLVNRWRYCFDDGGNWLRVNHNAPSILVRVDYVIDRDGNAQIYEVEERPAGLGAVYAIHPELYKKIKEPFVELDVKILVSDLRRESSDDFFQPDIKVIGKNEIPDNGLLYVRANRDETDLYYLTDRSVSTIKQEGSKAYGVSLGLWSTIPPSNDRNEEWYRLLFERNFAIKASQCSRYDGTKIWTTDKKRGADTKSKIISEIESGRAAYIQQYHQHEDWHTFLPPHYSLFRRTYLIFDRKLNEYKVVGGLYMCVPGVRGHGTSNAITGKLEFE